jgi:hypothetical protein
MKNLKANILTGLAALLFTTCSQEPDKIIYKGPDFVFFDSKSQISLYENQKTALSIPIKISLPQTSTTRITYQVTGENVLLGTDYKVQTVNPVEIGSGTFGSVISILPVDNAIIQPEKRTITIKILSVDNPLLEPQVVKEVEIDLLEDDCAPTVPRISLWAGGSVNIQGYGSSTSTGTAEGGSGGICGGSLSVTGKFFSDSNPSTTMTIIMTQNQTVTTKGTASVIRFPMFTGSTQYDYEAGGTYDELSKTITLNFTVYLHADGTTVTSGTHIITPK